MILPFELTCHRPLLFVQFDIDQTLLSWSLTRPGFRSGRRVAWLEVRNSDLAPQVDPYEFLDARMAAAGLADAVALMTSRDVRRHHLAQAIVDGAIATCLATVGLSNSLRVGHRSPAAPVRAGTINILVHVSQTLSQAAMIETLSVATQARTAALLDLDYRPEGLAITGTGTDCIVVAAPARGEPAAFAGLHTAIGEAVGTCVTEAIREGGQVWLRERSAREVWEEHPGPQDAPAGS